MVRWWTKVVRGPAGLAASAGALAGAMALALGLAGAESSLRSMRDTIRPTAASGQLHIVEIDARSLSEIDRWPWPRSEHAALIDALRLAGARSIAFDVDFSSRSTPAEDAALAGALERAGGAVILPTLRQHGGAHSNAIVESLPVAALGRHAVLGSVSILPDADGRVRSAPYGIVTGGVARPSLSSLIAGRAGRAYDHFRIDYAIRPESIPRHSFVDITRNGHARALAGKDVLVGATAVEMGDRYAVPLHGVLPGVVIQALAAETLIAGTPRVIPGALLLIAVLLAMPWVGAPGRKAAVLARAGLLAALILLGITASEHWLSVSAAVMPAIAGLTGCAVTRITAIGLAERRAAARIDPESGLPNRMALLETPGCRIIVGALIDRYDDIAAEVGSQRMGECVARLAQRIEPAVGTPVHRVGDRGLAWAGTDADQNIMALVQRVRALLMHPVELDGRRIDLRVTMGVCRDHPCTPATLLDRAMAAAEQAQADNMFWTEGRDSGSNAGPDRLSLMSDLAVAIDSGAIAVHFQPKLALSTGSITSAEALVRWQHPDHGMIAPDRFIAMAEQNNRIDRLTLHVVDKALALIAGTQGLTVAVNLSAKLLLDEWFNADLDGLLARRPSLARRLIFEVTESAAMTDLKRSAQALERFRNAGIMISMDDYGTGQSTLSYIQELPLGELKLDRQFVQHAHLNREDGILVRSTIDMAHALGIRVVAEGVEEQACLDFLATCGCDYVQGWLISKALPADEFLDFTSRFRLAA